MKRFFLTLLALIVAVPLAAAAYLGVSPYHEQLRKALPDPAKRQEAVQKAIDFEKIHVSALQGHVNDEYRMGRHLVTGDLGFKDMTQALYWYRRAADKGMPRAQLMVAHCYFAGDVVAKDDVRGAAWVKTAADAGLPEARDMLGALYIGGIGMPQDFMQGLHWLKGARTSDALKMGIDLDEKLKATYALPADQRDAQLKAVEEDTKTAVRAKMPDLLTELVKAGLAEPETSAVAAK